MCDSLGRHAVSIRGAVVLGLTLIVAGAWPAHSASTSRAAAPASAPTRTAADDFCALCSRGTAEQIAGAVKAGASVNGKGSDGATPLCHAASDNNPEVVDALIRAGADVNAKLDNDSTPLMYAACQGKYPDVISVLVKAGADPKAATKSGETALVGAAGISGCPGMIPALVMAGVDVNARCHGMTPLIVAAKENPRFAITLALIEAGVELDATDSDGKTALDWAREKHHNAVLRTLIKAGAKGATPDDLALAAAPRLFTGTVVDVQRNSVSIRGTTREDQIGEYDGAPPESVVTDRDTVVAIDGKSAAVADLKPGMEVAVRRLPPTPRHPGLTISATTPPAPRP